MALWSTDQDKLLRMLRRRHPDYTGKLTHWLFLNATYEGGRNWFTQNIFRYLKEGDQEFKDRLARCYRFNHTREVVDLITKYIYKTLPRRNDEDAPKEVLAFWKNATLSGLNINQFMKLVAAASSIDGRIWVFVDTTKKEDMQSVADAKKKGARVYAYIVRAKDVLDMGIDEDTGRVRWILVREYARNDADPIESNGAMEERYRLWTETEWALYKIEKKNQSVDRAAVTAEAGSFAVQPPTMLNPSTTVNLYAQTAGSVEPSQNDLQVKLLDKGEVSIKRLPCFPVDNVIGDHTYSAPALIEDIAYLDRAVANYLSNMDAIIQDQTFSQLAMPAQGLLPGDDKYDLLREMGTKRIFLYDGEAGEPKYLSPDPRQVAVITDTINKIIHEIYNTVGASGERTKQDNAVGIDNSSGVAKAYDFERLDSLLTTKGNSLENAENNLCELVMLLNGQKKGPEEELVAYPESYDTRSLADEFAVAQSLVLVDAPETIRREQMRGVKDKLFPVLPKALDEQMDKDLENWPKDPIEQAAALADATRPPTAFPGDKGKAPATKKSGKAAGRQGQVTSQTK